MKLSGHFQARQYAISFLTVAVLTAAGLAVRGLVDYKVVGYALLVGVSLLAIFRDIMPVLSAALLSALSLDFFFIKPYYTLHIDSASDALLLLLFFVIAMVNAVLTYKIRKAEQLARIRETRWNTMKLYNTLLDSLSHELRTPIATIMGGVGALQEAGTSFGPDKRQSLLSEMEQASQRLNQQVENLLNMSRLESGFITPNPDWLDIRELIYSEIDLLKNQLANHNIKIDLPDYLPLFRLDEVLTRQVIHNLLANAAQHTPKGAAITISAAFGPEVDFEFHGGIPATCVLTVSDDGPGFPQAAIPHAFDKFYRVENARAGGTGLGLSIVKGLTEVQNGHVSLANRPEGGAVFTVRFPAAVMQIKGLEDE